MNEESCLGCVFLYKQDHGYSNYTVTETVVHCAQNRNQHLKAVLEEPYDWLTPNGEDRWWATQYSRCELYANVGANVHLDVDGENDVDSQLPDHPHFAMVIKLHRNM